MDTSIIREQALARYSALLGEQLPDTFYSQRRETCTKCHSHDYLCGDMMENIFMEFDLYRLRLKPNAVLGAEIHDPEEDWAEVPENEAYPYINRYEVPGTNSIIAHTSALEVVSCEVIDFDSFKERMLAARNKELTALSESLGVIVAEKVSVAA